MDSHAQRLTLARAHGFTDIREADILDPVRGVFRGALIGLPDYLNSLDAMRCLITDVIIHGPTLKEYLSNADLFQEQLDAIEEREQVPCWYWGAELYAEAVLKTLGLWEESGK